MAKQQVMIIVPRNGITAGEQQVRAIYSPLVAEVLKPLGESELRRASHVEPGSELKQTALDWLWVSKDPQIADTVISINLTATLRPEYLTKWWADLLPVGGPVLGPFDTNTEALQAEVDWLKLHRIPVSNKPAGE